MKGLWKYYILLGAAFLVVVIVDSNTPRPVDWRDSYSQFDRIPNGTRVLSDLLPTVVGSDVRTVNESIYKVLDGWKSGSRFNYVIINDEFSPDPLDVRSLLNWVRSGNTAFISASYLGPIFSDSLGIAEQSSTTAVIGAAGGLPRLKWPDSIFVRFTNPQLHGRDQTVRVGTSSSHYETVVDSTARVIAVDAEDQPVFLSIAVGRGTIYLHSLPAAFTNYNVLRPDGARHPFTALSYLPARATLWDEHYKAGRIENRSALQYITRSPWLRVAWWLTLAGAVLFVFVYGRRRQRPVPLIQPLANTTVEFAQMMGRLYFDNADHARIADRKVSHFLLYLRTRLGLRTDARGEELYRRVAERSGVPINRVRELFTRIAILEYRGTVDDDDLLALDNALQDFYSNSKR